MSTSVDGWVVIALFVPPGDSNTFRVGAGRNGVGNTSPCNYLHSASIAQNECFIKDVWVVAVRHIM